MAIEIEPYTLNDSDVALIVAALELKAAHSEARQVNVARHLASLLVHAATVELHGESFPAESVEVCDAHT
jgi:hypothetical protein